MSQLSLFETEETKHPAQKIFFKVRFTNLSWRTQKDFIHTYDKEHQAAEALNNWLQKDRYNSGIIYRERKTEWAIIEDLKNNQQPLA